MQNPCIHKIGTGPKLTCRYFTLLSILFTLALNCGKIPGFAKIYNRDCRDFTMYILFDSKFANPA